MRYIDWANEDFDREWHPPVPAFHDVEPLEEDEPEPLLYLADGSPLYDPPAPRRRLGFLPPPQDSA